ncbi:amidase family protein [Mesorhizobium sp. M1348]|uniref:amidase family protein n=1 Tax=Mesorhizobium sp. M1348 TaxID=2957089 RepID=UPI0033359D21
MSNSLRFAETLDLTRATVADLQTAFRSRKLSSEKLTALYLARIKAYDKQGPSINSVIMLNPNALHEARALDRERRAGHVRSPLHGIPILVKDNFNTTDMPTTAGSQLLAGSVPPNEAFVLRKLRASGAIIIAKVNMSEFAGSGGTTVGATDPEIIKKGHWASGFSSLGLQTLNPHALDRSPSGSSGGTGASVAAAFGQLGLGTDTGGSVRYPSSANGIVGLKPTYGLVSRAGIVPLARSLDTAGPMARSVYDLAVALGIMAGVDPEDPATQMSAGKAETDYTKYLKRGALKGARIGIGRDFMGCNPAVDKITEQAIATLRSLGAEIVDPIRLPDYLLQARSGIYELLVNAEFKAQITDYLQTLKPGFPRNFDEIVALANNPATRYRNPGKAFALKYSQQRAVGVSTPTYLAARYQALPAIKAGMEAVFAEQKVDAIFTPTMSRLEPLITEGPQPADQEASGLASCRADSPGDLINESWLPEIVVPAGMTNEGMPVTISFIGTAFSEASLIGYAYDFEQATRAVRLPKNTPPLSSDVISY